MSVGNTKADAVDMGNKAELEEQKLCLRIILWLTAGNHQLNIDDSVEVKTSNISDALSGYKIEIEDERPSVPNTVIENRYLLLLENNRNIDADVRRISNIIKGYKSQYKSIEVSVVLLANSFESTYSYDLLSKLSQDSIFNDEAIEQTSTLTATANVSLSTDVKRISNKDSKDSDEQWCPGNIDAKIAAIFSHYVYFYLDWLELSEFYKKGEAFVIDENWNLTEDQCFMHFFKENKTETKLHIYSEKDRNKKQSTGLFNKNEKEGAKIKLRVINRLWEITKVCQIEDIDKQKRLISSVLDYCSVINRPMEFYELYEKFGYWNTIKDIKDYDENGQILTLIDDAKLWHVSHPGIVYERISGEKWSFFKQKHVFIVQKSGNKLYYYNTILKSGMGKFDGYGGLLFVKTNNTDPEKPIKFAYVTKGTDVNSINDWLYVDVLQGVTGFSLQHLHTVNNAKTLDNAVRRQFGDVPLFYAGHSLGGGLASSNAIASKGRHAITFNAAGLNFIGSAITRLFSAVTLNPEALNPSGVTNRVHPVRIKGEAIDELMKISKLILFGLNERGYGNNALIIDLHDGLYAFPDSFSKHGINNFLYNSLLNQVEIVEESTTKSAYVADSSSKVLFKIKMNGIRIKDIGNADITFIVKNGEAKFKDKKRKLHEVFKKFHNE